MQPAPQRTGPVKDIVLVDDERRTAMGVAARRKSDAECGPAVVAAATAAVYELARRDA